MRHPVVVVHQPDFMPYLGFFHRLYLADTFIVYDNAQFVKGGWHNRDQIKTAQGPAWITVPVIKKNRIGQNIDQAELPALETWRKKHLRTIEAAYRKAPHFAEVFALIEAVYAANHQTLYEHNWALISAFLDFFAVDVEILRVSELAPAGKSNALLIDLMKKVDCGTYLSGTGAKDYVDEDMWRDAGIELVWQEFEHPTYPQLHGEFVPYLSCIDFAMMCGPDLRRALGLD